MQRFSKCFRKLITFFSSNREKFYTPANGIDKQTIKDTKLWKVNRLPELIINLKKAILLISLTMCDTESLTTEVRESINACKSEIELKEKSDYCFINLCCLLLLLTISFLLKGNSVTSVAVNLLLCQLWFKYKFVKILSEFTDSSFRICECFHWCGNQEYWHQHLSEIRYLFCWECISDSSAELILLLVLLLWLCFWIWWCVADQYSVIQVIPDNNWWLFQGFWQCPLLSSDALFFMIFKAVLLWSVLLFIAL